MACKSLHRYTEQKKFELKKRCDDFDDFECLLAFILMSVHLMSVQIKSNKEDTYFAVRHMINTIMF